MPVIYIDVLIALNLFIDFLLLSLTARVLRRPHRRWRLVLSALCGGICACTILLPALPLPVQALIGVAQAALLVRIAFPFRGWRPYCSEVGVLFGVSALFAGVCTAVWFFVAPGGFVVFNGVVYYDVPPLLLVLLTLLSYGAVWLYDRLTHKRVPTSHSYRLTVTCGGQSITVRALHDTGNGLTDCFSGRPVVVAERAALLPLLPAPLRTVTSHDLIGQLGAQPPRAAGAAGPAQTAVEHRLRLVPFRSVGGEGLLPAFQPDVLTVTDLSGRTLDISGGYVALTDTLGRGEFQALIGNDIVSLFYSGGNAR